MAQYFNQTKRMKYNDDSFHEESEIDSLPDEILAEIFKYLDAEDLVVASKCCMRWNDLIASTSNLIKRIELAAILIDRTSNIKVYKYFDHGKYRTLFLGSDETYLTVRSIPSNILHEIEKFSDSIRKVTLRNVTLSVALAVLSKLENVEHLVVVDLKSKKLVRGRPQRDFNDEEFENPFVDGPNIPNVAQVLPHQGADAGLINQELAPIIQGNFDIFRDDPAVVMQYVPEDFFPVEENEVQVIDENELLRFRDMVEDIPQQDADAGPSQPRNLLQAEPEHQVHRVQDVQEAEPLLIQNLERHSSRRRLNRAGPNRLRNLFQGRRQRVHAGPIWARNLDRAGPSHRHQQGLNHFRERARMNQNRMQEQLNSDRDEDLDQIILIHLKHLELYSSTPFLKKITKHKLETLKIVEGITADIQLYLNNFLASCDSLKEFVFSSEKIGLHLNFPTPNFNLETLALHNVSVEDEKLLEYLSFHKISLKNLSLVITGDFPQSLDFAFNELKLNSLEIFVGLVKSFDFLPNETIKTLIVHDHVMSGPTACGSRFGYWPNDEYGRILDSSCFYDQNDYRRRLNIPVRNQRRDLTEFFLKYKYSFEVCGNVESLSILGHRNPNEALLKVCENLSIQKCLKISKPPSFPNPALNFDSLTHLEIDFIEDLQQLQGLPYFVAYCQNLTVLKICEVQFFERVAKQAKSYVANDLNQNEPHELLKNCLKDFKIALTTLIVSAKKLEELQVGIFIDFPHNLLTERPSIVKAFKRVKNCEKPLKVLRFKNYKLTSENPEKFIKYESTSFFGKNECKSYKGMLKNEKKEILKKYIGCETVHVAPIMARFYNNNPLN